MSSENIILSIDGHNYDQWKIQIYNAYKHGLLRLIITEEEWVIKFPGTPAPTYPGDMAENLGVVYPSENANTNSNDNSPLDILKGKNITNN
jgi:hypothetical protein